MAVAMATWLWASWNSSFPMDRITTSADSRACCSASKVMPSRRLGESWISLSDEKTHSGLRARTVGGAASGAPPVVPATPRWFAMKYAIADGQKALFDLAPAGTADAIAAQATRTRSQQATYYAYRMPPCHGTGQEHNKS